MNSERAKYLGRKAELETDVKRMEIRATGMIETIRSNLDPTADLKDLDIEAVAVTAVELSDLHLKYLADLKRLAKVKDILGE
ncbi:hypothetical protein [Desulfoplanes formicivorans]|uniref:Uncharacterized protein n=1 Tax=Desulfoplanes formicivorans TaxID=1592317 RepID=A0A194AFZ6_9BACT|nr:hypothetical protein [Desulfoplanes formicivorans]GAU08130.1 hypothetical protein DPF_0833 [Desulfoplanes formicivorans]